MADLFWLSDEQWAVVGRFMPTNQPGARRVDERCVVSGILHMQRSSGGRWSRAAAYRSESAEVAGGLLL